MNHRKNWKSSKRRHHRKAEPVKLPITFTDKDGVELIDFSQSVKDAMKKILNDSNDSVEEVAK